MYLRLSSGGGMLVMDVSEWSKLDQSVKAWAQSFYDGISLLNFNGQVQSPGVVFDYIAATVDTSRGANDSYYLMTKMPAENVVARFAEVTGTLPGNMPLVIPRDTTEVVSAEETKPLPVTAVPAASTNGWPVWLLVGGLMLLLLFLSPSSVRTRD